MTPNQVCFNDMIHARRGINEASEYFDWITFRAPRKQ